MAHITNLLGYETSQIENVRSALEKARQNLNQLEKLLERIEKERPGDLSSASAKVGCPLDSSFKFMLRKALKNRLTSSSDNLQRQII